MKYITIERGEGVEEAKQKLRTYLDKSFSYYYAMEPPATLMGSAKILTLRGRNDAEIKAKIDGPGFIIEEIYKEFRR